MRNTIFRGPFNAGPRCATCGEELERVESTRTESGEWTILVRHRGGFLCRGFIPSQESIACKVPPSLYDEVYNLKRATTSLNQEVEGLKRERDLYQREYETARNSYLSTEAAYKEARKQIDEMGKLRSSVISRLTLENEFLRMEVERLKRERGEGGTSLGTRRLDLGGG